MAKPKLAYGIILQTRTAIIGYADDESAHAVVRAPFTTAEETKQALRDNLDPAHFITCERCRRLGVTMENATVVIDALLTDTSTV